MAQVFTREQFYELVWSRPMTHLAKEFAISDVALHKICRKHGIPNPPLGWWAKKAAGKKVKQTPLPEAKPGAPDRITIAYGEFGRESANLAAAREQARIQASEGDDNEAAPPHPIVDRTIATLRKAKPSDIWSPSAKVDSSSARLRRDLSIASQLSCRGSYGRLHCRDSSLSAVRTRRTSNLRPKSSVFRFPSWSSARSMC